MSENSTQVATPPPNLLTTSAFRALHSRHGFSQSQSGTDAVLNDALIEITKKLTKAAMLQAEHEKHSGLNGSHAQKAIAMTGEIPKGFY